MIGDASLARAIRSAAPKAPAEAIDGLVGVKARAGQLGALDTPLRAAHLIGQCAHESMGFQVTEENLRYTTAERIRAVFGKRRFPALSDAQAYVRKPEALANLVYGGRMGNIEPNDGWGYRGRGYLQLTGRENYRTTGLALGLGLEASPGLAEAPATAWQIAAHFFATHKRGGKSAFEWADENNVEQVTRIVNGGQNGIADRRTRTARALAAIKGD